jgi:hypothetical protein
MNPYLPLDAPEMGPSGPAFSLTHFAVRVSRQMLKCYHIMGLICGSDGAHFGSKWLPILGHVFGKRIVRALAL